jgi:hypothetical protein
MQLTEEQKQTVKKWVDEGLGLSDLQKKLETDLGMKMTYMDVRFLVLELGLTVKDKKVSAPVKTDLSKAVPNAADAGDEAGDLGGEDGALGGGAVKVELNRISKPGALVSGTVTFSDGVKSDWWLDQYGRLALNPTTKGYQPPPEDIQDFQTQLRTLLQTRGY